VLNASGWQTLEIKKKNVSKQDAFFMSGIGKPVIQLNNTENLTPQESD